MDDQIPSYSDTVSCYFLSKGNAYIDIKSIWFNFIILKMMLLVFEHVKYEGKKKAT